MKPQKTNRWKSGAGLIRIGFIRRMTGELTILKEIAPLQEINVELEIKPPLGGKYVPRTTIIDMGVNFAGDGNRVHTN